jgi:DNA polymerase
MKQKKVIALAALSNIPAKLSDASSERVLCATCGLFKKCSTPFMRPRVPEDWSGKLLCVGEGPGQHEDEESGKPFTGPSGKLIRKLYQKAGFDDRDVAFVNAVRCRVPQNGKPSMAQIRSCRPFLLQIIRKLSPRYCLGLGGVALRALSNNGDANITRGRGKKIIIPGLEKCPLTYVTFHPASVLWGSFENEQRIVEDLERFDQKKLNSPKLWKL